MSKFSDENLRDLKDNARLPLVRELIEELVEARAALRPFARNLHSEANFHHNFGVVVNGPTPDRHLITLLASDFDAAVSVLAEQRR